MLFPSCAVFTLLVAACCTIQVATARSITCEGSDAQLQCDCGTIHILSANYGRTDTQVCAIGRPENQISNNKCVDITSNHKITESCEGKQKCVISASNSVFGDPCYGTYKYLDIIYTCVQQQTARNSIVCEGSNIQLQCGNGQIKIQSATYGRRDPQVCSAGRPLNQITNTNCISQSSISKLIESCKGRNQCVVQASNSVFGDPCVGTYKYLEVAYVCG
ncbi:hypothetical protein UPYG_G00164120 [Umbra pygmaea]|uniref:SUEL-type lectin domain-containing protein n=1 Tax=Umbra pygmaea TaxID=75934 RepID=A0ABD0X472_UMBPY